MHFDSNANSQSLHGKNVLKLGVNIDHVATLREARGTTYPSPLEAARICEAAGAHGLTIHLREDRRHIQDADVVELVGAAKVPVNLELATAGDIVDLAVKMRPAEACLVPERREEVTTEGGLDAVARFDDVSRVTERLRDAGIRVSLFIEADAKQLDAARAMGAPVVELHTGAFCDAEGGKADQELERLIDGARIAHGLGLQVNAGHGINMDNFGGILRIPHLDTLNIGHSIVARAVMVGMDLAVREVLEVCRQYESPR